MEVISLEERSEQPKIAPQAGPQETFLSSSADIAVYGGAAGGGKSFAGLLEPLYHINNPGFEAIMFRRIYRQITAPGGLWDRSMEIYPQVGGRPHFSAMSWDFPSGAKVRFSHMQYEQDCISWKGAEITLIIFDELTDFSEYQFWYMLSRNRSLCGIKPYMRAMTNPDSESWVKPLLAPWIEADYPDPAKSGELRYFRRVSGQLEWCDADTPMAKSITFIAATVFDNKILLEKDPAYLANLNALPELERQRLLLGNWHVRASGSKFKREWFQTVDAPPSDIVATVRFWDLAATETEEEDEMLGGKKQRRNGPDYTAGVKVAMTSAGTYCILDAVWFRKSPRQVSEIIAATAAADGIDVSIYMEEEPGSGGKNTIDTYRRTILPGYDFHGIRRTGSKILRGNIVSSMCEGHAVSLLKSWWNEPFLNFLVAFPNPAVHDDAPDSFFGAMEILFSMRHEIGIAISNTVTQAGVSIPTHQAPEDWDEQRKKALADRQAMTARILNSIGKPWQTEKTVESGDSWIA